MIPAVSLFSGAGGLDYAFEITGSVKTILCLENSPDCLETLRRNQGKIDPQTNIALLSEARIVDADLEMATAATLSRLAGCKPDLVYGGPPCQSFSVLGKRKGVRDKRGTLTSHFAELVCAIKPRGFLLENVPGLLSIHGGSEMRKLCRRFHLAGYSVAHAVICAADYGDPTSRKRLIMLGIRKPLVATLPKPTHAQTTFGGKANNLQQWIPCGTVIKRKDVFRGISNHTFVKHTEEVVGRFSRLAFGERDEKRRRNRLDPQRPAFTLFAGGGRLPKQSRTHIHPYIHRELSPRECAALHGFPDWWEFAGPHDSVLQQVANSVPTSMGSAMANHLVALLKEKI
jgi:DNA (cytosine-5)-methyltransferase 1